MSRPLHKVVWGLPPWAQPLTQALQWHTLLPWLALRGTPASCARCRCGLLSLWLRRLKESFAHHHLCHICLVKMETVEGKYGWPASLGPCLHGHRAWVIGDSAAHIYTQARQLR